MFYSQFILAKKGPLATIWIAAHLERKLRKNQITETDIGDSVDSILYPEVPIALRLSGHLLLGVVRIYSRKVNLLFHDCSEALDKIRQAFQTSAVDLPPGSVVAPYHSITLPDSFDFDDLEAHFGRENAAAEARTRNEFAHHVTARDLITLQDQNEDHQYFVNLDERFAGEGNPYAVLDLSIEDLNAARKSDAPNVVSLSPEVAPHVAEEDVLPPFPMEEDMEFEGMDQDRVPASPKFDVEENVNQDAGDRMEPQADALEERLRSNLDALLEVPEIEKLRSANEANNQDHVMGLGDLDMEKEVSASMDADDGYRSVRKHKEIPPIFDQTPVLREEPTPSGPQTSSPVRSLGGGVFEDNDILGSILRGRTPKLDVVPTPVVEKRGGRKRKRVFDAALVISSAEMRKQLKTTSDICRVRKKAPSTEYEIWMSRRVNHMEQKFLSPSAPGMPDELKDQFDCVLNRVLKTPGRDTRSSRGLLRSQVKEAGGKLKNDVEKADQPIENITADEKDTEVGLHEPENGVAVPETDAVAHDLETTCHDLPDQMDQPTSSAEKAVEHVDDAQPREPSSPIFQNLVDHADGGAIDVFEDPSNEAAENQLNGGLDEEPLVQSATVEERQTSNEAMAHLSDGSEGLGFLGDSRETDEAAYDLGSTDELMGSSLEDNSGWSSRTRAVAQYLKERFEASERGSSRKQGKKQEAHKLSLESLLKGRKRKEAARMFFETLVLGSKGYLQVEQDAVYADIYLGQSQRLMKAVF